MTALWVLKSNVLNAHLLQVVCDWENQYRQTDIWTYINGEVKVVVILSKMIFSCSKPLHAHVQYVFNESAKYQYEKNPEII